MRFSASLAALVLAGLPSLVACAPGDAPAFGPSSGGSGDGGDEGPGCPASDLPAGLTLLHEAGRALRDGDEVTLARRVQGDVTLFAPLLFDGLPGGELVTDFAVTFSADGVELGERRDDIYRLPCDRDGRPAAPRLEIFFDRRLQAGELDGLRGLLRAALVAEGVGELHTSAEVVLAHE